MSTTTEATPPPPDIARPGGAGGPAPAGADPYLRGTDETVLLDLRELRAQQAAEAAAAPGNGNRPGSPPGTPGPPGTDLEAYQGSHRRDALLYAHGGTAIPLERVREVCHDLRQPVAAILMLASAAEMRPDVPERVRDVLQEIMTQTEDISATVRQFLDDAKQGVDGLGDPVPTNVAGLAAQAVERWRATFSGRISLAAGEEPLHVTVDPVLFKRALGNVLSNGTRAAGGTGRVQVTVRRFETPQGERAVIDVDDSGPGFGNIPAGHGLGLAVVRRTVEAAGGSVEVTEGPLGGALIRLVLPVTPARPLSPGDEMARTIHGEVSLSALAEELAAGGLHPALVDFDDVEFETGHFAEELDGPGSAFDESRFDEGRFDEGRFDESADDDDDEFDAALDRGYRPGAPADVAAVAGGHAFATRISAWSAPEAITGAPRLAALPGPGIAGDGAGWLEPRGIAELDGAGRLEPRGAAEPDGAGRLEPHAAAELTARKSTPTFFDAFSAPQRGPEAVPEAAPRSPAPEPSETPAAPAQPLEAAKPAISDAHRFEITATGQDGTAVAAIQLPPRTGLTQPPRIPASALRPVAQVQLSLLPGGAF